MITTDTGAKKIEGTDNWREIFDAHNDSVDAYNQAIAKVENGLAYIVGNKNLTGLTLSVGQYVYVKDHSTIANGLRKVTASISNNGDITTNNTGDCPEGGLNALNSNFSPTTFSPVTVPHGSVESGGYIKIGKLVILQVRIRTTEATIEFITGLPKPLNKLSTPTAGVVRVAENISIDGSGTVVSSSSLNAGVYQFTTIYVCE